MASDDSEPEQTDLTIVEESLMSFEKLDRSSPELWPEQIPGVSEFVAQNSAASKPEQPSWTTSLSPSEINQLHQLGNLSMDLLIKEVKKLHDMAYELGVEEAREMTRGKYLNIFKHK
ncbi:protein lin-52 homolog isoform X2 [Belonocnema kinseyi]|uniref:protein lin-52 homolog isoform X2 n=1 Tax=Belonocnema kinseyi TaxID=2817044 RepID=UPI00143DFCFD|nr:protein lin-52 homolog isoform X2 [Belonocnema kinseyi]